MFERISNGWEMAKDSFRVLSMDKELLIFPLCSGICCLLVLGSFALPLYDSAYVDAVMAEQASTVLQDPVAYAILFAFYLCNYFIITFFNSALVACAVIRFNGGDPTVADGFRAAMARLPQIFAWALVAATVGTLLRLIETKAERVGRIVSGVLGMAWTIATFFVVPVLVVERTGPIDAIRRSVGVLRKTWGESLVANFGIGLISFLFMCLAAIPMLIGALVAGPTGFLVGLTIFAVLAIIISLATSAAQAILLAALYEFAARDQLTQYFDKEMLRAAFVERS